MKKKLGLMLFVSGLLLFSTTMAINENKKEKIYENVSQSDWESLGNNYWSKAICKEEKEVEVYSGEYRVIWDHFKNSNPKGGLSYYILDAKSMDSGNYILYNTSSDGYNNELVIWNSSVFQNRAGGSKIQPGEIVRHMTTAEEVGGTFKYGPWTLSSPVTDSLDNKKFQKANYRSDGSHPNKPTMSPNWDAEIRIMTLYDEDHNPGSSSDNKVIVECQKMVIRRCGDGILDKEHEECDPEVEPWKSDGTCDPDTCKKSPKCNSQYNGQTLDELPSKDKLCEVGVVTNLQEDAEGWRWSCSNEAGTDSTCYAKKPNNGDFIIKKTLISETKYITGVGQELVWEIKVTASGGNVKDMRIKDELPSVLDFVSYSSQLPSGVTIDEKQQPTFSNDNKTIYWQTKGILKDGDSIVLIVVTKANAMPKATDNYDNVACASPEDNPEDEECDKKPIEGMPVIEKTLTGKKMVENTGEYLTWEVKVTASGGDISGFQIWDVMPNKLKLESAKLVGETRGVSIKKLDKTTASGAYHTVYYWDTEGTLRAGKTITMLVTTKVMEMPKANEDLLNVACVVKEGYVDCDEDQPEEGNPKLWIKKYILDGGKLVKHKNVKIGDKITYRINFGNSGDAVGTIVSIKDFLPKNVRYLSSEIFIVTGTNSSGEQVLPMILTGAAGAYEILDGVYIDIFGGITLQPGQRGYIILTGEILTGFQDQRTNFACIYDDEDLIACDDASHDLGGCDKLEIATTNLSTNGGNTTVKCTTIGGQTGDIKIDCGNNKEIISGSNISVLSGTCNYPSGKKTYTVTCIVSPEKEPSNSCKGDVSVPGNGGGSSCFIAGTLVTMADGTEKRIEEVKIGEKVLGQNGEVNEVKGYDRPTLDDRNLWKINGKGGYFVSDEHPFMTTKGWKSFDPVMSNIEIENARKEGMLKGGNYPIVSELEIGDILITKDGKEKITDLETLDPEKKDPNTQLYNLVLNGNNTYYANGYLVHNKGTSGGGGSKSPVCQRIDTSISDGIKCESHTAQAYFKLTCDDKEFKSDDKDFDYKFKFEDENGDIGKYCKTAKKIECAVSKTNNGTYESSNDCKISGTDVPQGCFNVNAGNFSIEEKEIFPFYWNMSNLESDYYGNKDSYTVMNGDYRNAKDNFDMGGRCESNQDGKIAGDSMVCTFKIFDAKNGGKNPLYTIEGPCLSKDKAIMKSKLISRWYDAMVDAYCDGTRECYFYYGESKTGVKGAKEAVLPTAVYYIDSFGSGAKIYANVGGDSREIGGNIEGENNKYFGEYKIELSNVKYLRCNNGIWEQEDPEEDACQNNFVLTNSYTVQKTPSGNLRASTEKLKKYVEFPSGETVFADYLNAIKTTAYEPNGTVNDRMKGFINKYSKLAVKVNLNTNSFLSGTQIKKVPGKNIYFVEGDITVKGGDKTIDKPFTIVQTIGNTIISGDVKHNMMLMTEGNITFKGDCKSDQTVKGIFYANGKLIRQGVGKNKDINNDVWCKKGGLHVKGVLIGKEFNNLMNGSRSHINERFEIDVGKKKPYVMNGASVVIEYSPSIFTKSTMPPGAEDFTTALSIYKN